MVSHSQRSRLALLLVVGLLIPMLGPASISAKANPSREITLGQDKKDKGKDDKSAQKDDKNKLSKQERKYLQVMRFSKDRYDNNNDFRQEVDESYRRMQREHSEYAFSINLRDPNAEQVAINGDKIKIAQTLYDNPLAQDYVNRVGQSLVPVGSKKLYAFKIILNPIPEARSLSTGTVYVSTGLLSSVDNEAQLAYVLGHEIAHAEKDHWKDDVLVAQGLDAWNEKQGRLRSAGNVAANIGLSVATAGLFNAVHLFGAAGVDPTVPTIVKLAIPNAVISWDRQQEDEADELALHYMLERKYDPREVPKFYAKLKDSTRRDTRTGLGFMANAARIAERQEYLAPAIAGLGSPSTMLIGAVDLSTRQQINQMVDQSKPAPEKKAEIGKILGPTKNAEARGAAAQNAIVGDLAAEVQKRLEAGDLIGTSAEFELVMAGITRDNGVRAYYYDMFQMARDNLEESLRIRSNDPYTHYYYGKMLKLTARTLSEKLRARDEFVQAIQYDKRQVLAEPYLFWALSLIDNKDSQTKEIVDNLKVYVAVYQRQHAGELPTNMDVIYDYLQEAGETSWTAIPAMNVSTKNIDPLGITSSSAKPASMVSNQSQPEPAQIKKTSRRP
jgi:hypothetical protein